VDDADRHESLTERPANGAPDGPLAPPGPSAGGEESRPAPDGLPRRRGRTALSVRRRDVAEAAGIAEGGAAGGGVSARSEAAAGSAADAGAAGGGAEAAAAATAAPRTPGAAESAGAAAGAVGTAARAAAGAVGTAAGAADSLALARRVVELAEDKKAADIVLLDLRELTSLADFFVICSGGSERQLDAIADAVVEGLHKEGRPLQGREGRATSHWILLDYGTVVVHIFAPLERDYYQLERHWAAARVVLRVQ
jgi:ribosome-associated protein